jgi:hypothetical protein
VTIHVPVTRTLPYVLRQALNRPALQLEIAEVVAIPDGLTVTIDMDGVEATIPRVACYLPTVGEAAYIVKAASVWIAFGAVGGAIPSGEVGPQGPPGPTGPAGPTGPTGPGVPVGGAVGQVLAKKTATDFDTQWITPATGGTTTVSPWAGGPPASPATGDVWIATAVDGAALMWSFRYNGASASAYKWEALQGFDYLLASASSVAATTGSWQIFAGLTTGALRAGEYNVRGSAAFSLSAAGSATVNLGYAISGTNQGSFSGESNAAGYWVSLAMEVGPVVLTAGQTLAFQYFANSAMTMSGRSFAVTPRRIS